MNVIRLTYDGLGREKRTLILALIGSLLFHLFLFYLLGWKGAYRIDLKKNLKNIQEEVTILFPENKPKYIVENVNENGEAPEKSDLLSERNSRAANESLLEQKQNQPYSNGNVPFANLSQVRSLASNSYARNSRAEMTEKFKPRALLGERSFQTPDNSQAYGFTPAEQQTYVRNDEGTPNLLNQKEFSADQLGNLTLSTYQWEWASYINYFKNKLYQVWRTPPAYFSLGLIHGYTVIRLTIDRSGQMVSSEVLKHEGHSSLQTSSENAVNAVFPLKPLPADFPDQTLVLTLTLFYPNLRAKE